MIFIVPMLISSTLENSIVLPGITKAIERYCIVYKLDTITKSIREAVELGTGDFLTEDEPTPPWTPKDTRGQGGGQPRDSRPDTKVDIYSGNEDAIMLEPTWMKVDTKKGTQIVGVKVLPFIVKSDESLIQLIMTDVGRTKFDTFMTSKGRTIARAALKVWKHTGGKIFKKPGLKSDPMNDIIWGYSSYDKEICSAIDKSELTEDFYKNLKNVKKLFKLKWTSLIFCDNIKKEAWFCMEEFKGLCSMLPYTYLYNTLSRQLGTAYDNREEVKKTTSPFFKLSTKMTNVVGEQLTVNKLDKFSKLDE